MGEFGGRKKREKCYNQIIISKNPTEIITKIYLFSLQDFDIKFLNSFRVGPYGQKGVKGKGKSLLGLFCWKDSLSAPDSLGRN